MANSVYQDFLKKSLLTTIEQNYNDFLEHLVINYSSGKFTKEDLISSFPLEINGINKINECDNEVNRQVKIKQKIVRKQIAEDKRCIARVWTSNPVIKNNNEWIYGKQCSLSKKYNSSFCGIHSKKLPHGIYGEPPPHRHFDKYK